jgi:hypothetical protein
MKTSPIYRIPTAALWLGYPVRGTFIAVLLQRSFDVAPAWVWGVMWTVMALLWGIAIFDRVSAKHITHREWERVFGACDR